MKKTLQPVLFEAATNEKSRLMKNKLVGYLLLLPTLVTASACSSMNPLTLLNKAASDCTRSNVLFDKQHELRADFYYPEDTNCNDKGKFEQLKLPTVVFIHGGSWRSGSKELYGLIGAKLAAEQFLTIIPEYRLYPKTSYPGFIEDLETFTAWLHDNSEQLGVDLDNVHIVAHSAGAFNVASFLLQEQYKKPFMFQQFIGLAGPYDFFLPTENDKYSVVFSGDTANTVDSLPVVIAKRSSLSKQSIDTAVKRVVLLHGADDEVVAPENLITFPQSLQRFKIPVLSFLYKDTGHVDVIAGVSGLPFVKSFIADDLLALLSGAELSETEQQAVMVESKARIAQSELSRYLDRKRALQKSAMNDEVLLSSDLK